MSWMSKLYETYDHIEASDSMDEIGVLWPISHFVKNAHVEIVLNTNGLFLKGRTRVLHGIDSPTLIPATEASAGRAGSKIAPHPLCDELGYCASDYPKMKSAKVKCYMEQLSKWVESSNSNSKVVAILTYLKKGTLWHDLQSEIEFPVRVKNLKGTSQKIVVNTHFK